MLSKQTEIVMFSVILEETVLMIGVKRKNKNTNKEQEIEMIIEKKSYNQYSRKILLEK